MNGLIPRPNGFRTNPFRLCVGVILGCLSIGEAGTSDFAATASTGAVGLTQAFDNVEELDIAAADGVEKLSAEVDAEGVLPGGRCLRVRFHSRRENGMARIAWRFPPADLRGRKFAFWLKPATPLRYFTIHVLDESGARIERHTWFGVPAGDWRIMKWWGGAKTLDNSFESNASANAARAACLEFRPGGGPDADVEVALDHFSEEGDLLRWLIKERPEPVVEGVEE